MLSGYRNRVGCTTTPNLQRRTYEYVLCARARAHTEVDRWSHGFIFPNLIASLSDQRAASILPSWIPPKEAGRWSTTTSLDRSYVPVTTNVTFGEDIESLIESSGLSLLHPHNLDVPIPLSELAERINKAYAERESRAERMHGWEAGSTIWVHASKRNEWW